MYVIRSNMHGSTIIEHVCSGQLVLIVAYCVSDRIAVGWTMSLPYYVLELPIVFLYQMSKHPFLQVLEQYA